MASCSRDETIRIWDVKSKARVASFRGPTNGVHCLDFSPDGRLVAFDDDGSRIQLWNVETGQCIARLEGHKDAVRCLRFSPDGGRLVSSALDCTTRLWEVNSAFCKWTITASDGCALNFLQFSPDGKLLASCSGKAPVLLWEAESGQYIASLQGHTDRVNCVSFSPDGRLLASGAGDKLIRIWSLDPAQYEVPPLAGYHDPVHSRVCLSPDGRRYAAMSKKRPNSIRIWDTEAGRCVGRLETPQDLRPLDGSLCYVSAFSPDGLWFAGATTTLKLGEAEVASLTETILIWNVETGALIASLPQGHDRATSHLSFNSDASLLAASDVSTVRLWNVQSHACVATLEQDAEQITSLRFSPDGQFLAASCSGRQRQQRGIHLWSVERAERIHQWETKMDPLGLCFSADGRLLAAAASSYVYIWDVETKRRLVTWRKANPVGRVWFSKDVQFSPDGKLLACIDTHRWAVTLFEVDFKRCVGRVWHTAPVDAIRFSRDSGRLVSVSEGCVRVWDMGREPSAKMECRLDSIFAASYPLDLSKADFVSAHLDPGLQRLAGWVYEVDSLLESSFDDRFEGGEEEEYGVEEEEEEEYEE